MPDTTEKVLLAKNMIEIYQSKTSEVANLYFSMEDILSKCPDDEVIDLLLEKNFDLCISKS